MQTFTQPPLTNDVRKRNFTKRVGDKPTVSNREGSHLMEEQMTTESMRLDLQRMETKLDTKLDILIQLVSRLGNNNGVATANLDKDAASASEISYLRSLTSRQHAVAQMLTQGLLNRDIAQVMCVGENTVKVHVRAVCKKADVKSRGQAAMIFQQIVEKVDEQEYILLSKGLPLDWFASYDTELDDPYFHLYKPFRDKG